MSKQMLYFYSTNIYNTINIHKKTYDVINFVIYITFFIFVVTITKHLNTLNMKDKRKEIVNEVNPNMKAVKEVPETQREILHFEVATEGVQKIGETIAAVVQNQYVKQVLITALNDNMKPVFKE